MALKDGLLHWWELDDTSWLDSHGTWNLTGQKDRGGADPSIDATGGPDGGPCLALNGTNYLDRTNVAWDGSGAARSVQICVRYSSLAVNSYLIIHGSNLISARIYQLNIPKATTISRTLFGDGTTYTNFGTHTTNVSTWYHILATSNGTNRHRLFLNGSIVDESTTALSGIDTSAQPLAVGTFSDNKASLVYRTIGRLSLAAVWERELSETEVVKLYNGGTMRRYAALESKSIVASLRRAHAEMRGMRA